MKKLFLVVLALLAFGQGIYALGIEDIAFRPDGKKIAFVGAEQNDKGIFTYMMEFNTDNGELSKIFYGEYREVYEYCLSYSPDGKTIAVGSGNAMVMLWDPINESVVKLFEGHEGSVHTVAFSPDGKILVSGDWNNAIKLWNIASGRNIRTITVSSNVNKIAFSPDGKTFFAGLSDGNIKQWNTDNGNEIRTFIGHQESVNSIAVSPDGKTLLSGSKDTNVKLWETATGKEKYSFVGGKYAINTVAFSPDGKIFAYGGTGDGNIRICDSATAKEIIKITGAAGMVRCIKFSPDGKYIVQTTLNQVVFWDVTSGRYVKSMPNLN